MEVPCESERRFWRETLQILYILSGSIDDFTSDITWHVAVKHCGALSCISLPCASQLNHLQEKSITPMYSLCQWKYNLWQTRGITPNVRCWYKPINTNTVGPRTQEPIPLGGHLDAAPWSSHPPWTSAKSSNAVVALELLSPAVRGLRQQLRGLWDAVSSLFGPCSFWRKCRYVSHPDSYGNDLNTFTVQWLTYIHTIILNIILHACFGVTAHSRTLKKKHKMDPAKESLAKEKTSNNHTYRAYCIPSICFLQPFIFD